MAIRIQTAQGHYPPAAAEIFDFNQLDAFHHPEVLQVLYGDAWHSVLITDEQGQALLHSYVPQTLPNAEPGFDIEPFIGYAGPVLTAGSSLEFRDAAWDIYSKHCHRAGIIAEIVRFSPMLNNAQAFADSSLLKVFGAKDIAIIECNADEAAQLATFNSKCRSSVKRGMRECTTALLNKATQWDAFVAFYYASLERIGADKKWFYPADVMLRASKSDFFQVHIILCQGEWASLALVIEHPLASYYFAAASGSQPVQGANEYLLFRISQTIAHRGSKHLILGGGNTADDDDPLLRFKRKFATELTPMLMGRCAHDAVRWTTLVNKAIAERPELADIPFFLKYRL